MKKPKLGDTLSEVRVRESENFFGIDVLFTLRQVDGSIQRITHDGLLEEVEHGARIAPTFTMSREQASEVMSGLIRMGITPVGEGPAKNELDAVRYHLEDMRTLVFPKKED